MREENTMDVVHNRCAGLDVSKRDAKVCVRVQSTTGASRIERHHVECNDQLDSRAT